MSLLNKMLNEHLRWWERDCDPVPPTFFCVGAMKCGTSTLHEYLSKHPQASVPLEKEINFLDRWRSTLTISQYEALFDKTAAVRGECCPQYCYGDAPHHLKWLFPDATVILLVRDPIARAISHVRHNRRYGVKVAPARQWDTAREPYLSYGNYRAVIEGFRAQGIEPHVLSMHDMASDPDGFYKRICAILGLDFMPFYEHHHISEGRPDHGLTSDDMSFLRDFYAEPNAWLKENYGIDLER